MNILAKDVRTDSLVIHFQRHRCCSHFKFKQERFVLDSTQHISSSISTKSEVLQDSHGRHYKRKTLILLGNLWHETTIESETKGSFQFLVSLLYMPMRISLQNYRRFSKIERDSLLLQVLAFYVRPLATFPWQLRISNWMLASLLSHSDRAVSAHQLLGSKYLHAFHIFYTISLFFLMPLLICRCSLKARSIQLIQKITMHIRTHPHTRAPFQNEERRTNIFHLNLR